MFKFKAKKRFIAGAICPKCSAMDKLIIYNENGQDFRECIECGFNDKMLLQSNPKELETRVNMSREKKLAETQIVKLIDPKNIH
ncbi:MAG: hypothetical protein CMK44_02265 [Porticoccus sp.]|jgi:uncharacterized metal-binding protein (TIGR02443 family)|nr:hypothetical protein [Porticoccus sp.]